MLRIVYRYTPIENAKPRPPFYSKAVSLASLLYAARELPPEAITVLADGPLHDSMLAILPNTLPVRPVAATGLEDSFLFALEVAAAFPPNDCIYLVEDDYLHLPNAIEILTEALDAHIGD